MVITKWLVTQLLTALRKDTVRPYVWGYYVAILAWGIYATFLARPSTVVEPVMGLWVYTAWVWMCMVAPTSVMIGMALRTGTGQFVGLWMQVLGNLAVGLILFAYEYSVIVGTAWGTGAFVIFIVPPYILGCVLLTAQASVKLYDVWQLAAELESGDG